jgi:hypothetical protein
MLQEEKTDLLYITKTTFWFQSLIFPSLIAILWLHFRDLEMIWKIQNLKREQLSIIISSTKHLTHFVLKNVTQIEVHTFVMPALPFVSCFLCTVTFLGLSVVPVSALSSSLFPLVSHRVQRRYVPVRYVTYVSSSYDTSPYVISQLFYVPVHFIHEVW